jgi:hypothetical protein
MPVDYVIDKERRLVITTGEGRVTFDEARDHQNRLLNDPNFDLSFNQLIDLTAVTHFDLSTSDAIAIARRSVFAKTSRRALVASDPLIFGMLRLAEAYHEGLAETHAFRDRESALKWLDVA